ncbi:type IV pilus assembly protein PilM [Patescibacteria group bacterium]|nr:type IV pilus assembly protein PilM [Patescibacteria group bacterium]
MRIFSKRCLGIDIGASSIKVVELSTSLGKKKLENYAEFQLPFQNSPLSLFRRKGLILLSDEVAEILECLLRRAKIKKKKVALSLPDFSTLFTTFDLPPMTEAEIPQAVEFEARHHIPLPLSEVTFDWQVIEKEKVLPGIKLKILLVAIPNRVLESYQRMATLSRLEVEGMEAEVFGLIRSSIPKTLHKKPVCLVDIGWESTTVSISQAKTLRLSHSFDISGKSFTQALSETLEIGWEEAENLKREHGLDPEKKEIFDTLAQKASEIAREIDGVCQSFHQTEGKKVEDVILAGGMVSLFGLKEYLSVQLKKNIQITDPFSQVSFPSILKPRLQNLGLSFGVALGVALRE